MSGLDALLHRRPPSAWQLFLRGPFVFLARKLYSWKRGGATRPHAADDERISVLCISDTHNSRCELPDADILIHAGDLTQSGSVQELNQSIAWLRAQPHGVKVVIAGNHDILLDSKRDDAQGKAAAARARIDWGDVNYLQDQALTVTCKNGRRLKIYGSPKSPRHGNWAFQYARHDDVWNNSVPDDTDILITHCPAHAHLDLGGLGCRHLLSEVWRVHPILHVFGHIHGGYGHEWLHFDALQNAYERTMLARGGLWNFLAVVRAFCGNYFGSQDEGAHQMVNASVVGGLRDEVRRKPIMVCI